MTAVNSLEQRFKRKLAIAFTIAFLVSLLLMSMLEYRASKERIHNDLELKYQTVQNAFLSYLQRAEFELSNLTQTLSAQTLSRGNEMNAIFASHDGFLLGGVDFIYADMYDGIDIEDPRVFLFLEEDIKEYIHNALLGEWQIFNTKTNKTLLVFKKKLLSSQSQHMGYLYGFVSLNNNLALANTLLNSVDLDKVSISDKEGNVLLQEEKLSFDGRVDMDYYAAYMPFFNEDNRLSLALYIKADDVFSLRKSVGYEFLFIFFAMWGGYLIVVLLVQRLIFHPMLKVTRSLGDETVSHFREIQEIQRVISDHSARVAEQIRGLHLLMDTTGVAIIFCDEVASVLRINSDAKFLFADAESARTVFDFMPINSHSPIQKALKGEVGSSFVLNFPQLSKIFQWKLFPYITENGFRGLALIGHDITRETQLEWQVSQLEPSYYQAMKKIDPELILSELNFLNDQSQTPGFAVNEWLSVFVRSLNGLVTNIEDQAAEPRALGVLVGNEFNTIPDGFGKHGTLQLDCDLDVACLTSKWPRDLSDLINVLIMMVYSSDLVEEKQLSFRQVNRKLVIQVVGISAVRPIFLTLMNLFARRLNAKVQQEKGGGISISYPYELVSRELVILRPKANVVWITNGAPDAERTTSVLRRLKINLICYHSLEDLLLNLDEIEKVDALLFGVTKTSTNYKKTIQMLTVLFDRNDLPIAWITRHDVDFTEDILVLNEFPCDYSVARLLSQIFNRAPLDFHSLLSNKHHWMIVGGSTVGRSIFRSELLSQDIVPHVANAMNDIEDVLKHHRIEVLVLLDDFESDALQSERLELSSTIVVVTKKSLKDVKSVYFPLTSPYLAEDIRTLIHTVRVH